MGSLTSTAGEGGASRAALSPRRRASSVSGPETVIDRAMALRIADVLSGTQGLEEIAELFRGWVEAGASRSAWAKLVEAGSRGGRQGRRTREETARLIQSAYQLSSGRNLPKRSAAYALVAKLQRFEREKFSPDVLPKTEFEVIAYHLITTGGIPAAVTVEKYLTR